MAGSATTPSASVVHCVPADRLTVEFFRRRHYAQGVSDEILLRLDGHRPSVGHRVGLTGELAKAWATMSADALRGRATTIDRFLISYWSGRLSALGLDPGAG